MLGQRLVKLLRSTTIISPRLVRNTFLLPRHLTTMSSIDQAKSSFFKAEHFAVVGASKDTAKIGNKVLRWYKARGLDAIPVHPKEASIEEISTIASVFDIHEPSATSLSIITPPKVSLPVCKTALLELGVNAIWLQPGAEDGELTSWIESCDESIRNKVIYGGPCILVEGDSLAKAQGKL